MTDSPSSSVRRARKELATRLRELRKDAELTARALSVATGWHESKTSRIESGERLVSDTDVRIWCRICGVSELADDLVAVSRDVDAMYVEWQRQHHGGLRRAQAARAPLYERTRHMRVYSSTVMPGLFQTPAYAGSLLSAIASFRRVPNDVEAAVEARTARNRVLHEGDHRFCVLMEESVLRYRIGDRETMRGQLEHLLGVMSLPSVAVGVVPFVTEERPVWPVETFTLFDTDRAHVETLSAQITVTAPGELGLYARAFEELAGISVFGARARATIVSAMGAPE